MTLDTSTLQDFLIRLAVYGAAGTEEKNGFISLGLSLTFVIFDSIATSAELYFELYLLVAAANGFIIPIFNPCLFRFNAIAAATVVFPTLVSVPVIKNPFPCKIIIITYHKKNLIGLDLEQADKRFVWHPYTQMKDWLQWTNKVIVKGDGFYLIDSDGNRYLDGCASMWCNVWGHSRKEIIDSIITQVKQLQHSTLFGLANGPAIELAEILLKILKQMDHVFYSDNGSTAIEAALKMSVQYWRNKGYNKKNRFLSLEHGYHGDTLGAMSVGYVPEYFRPYKSVLRLSKKISPPKSATLDEIGNHVKQNYIENLEKFFSKYSETCCAMVMESGAQIAGGVNVYPHGFQKVISELCNKYDILLIVDEIATGFGRLGNMVEYLAQRSNPDIVCMGKALTGGYFPLAVTLCKDEVYSAFLSDYSKNRHLCHGHTYTGHPVGCSVAITNLRLYRKYNLVENVRRNSIYLNTKLKELQVSPVAGKVVHKGLLGAVDLVRKKEKKQEPIHLLNYDGRKISSSNYIMREAFKMGVFMRGLGDTVVIIPPLAIGKKDLKYLLDVISELLKKIEGLV
jgi:adenosylmethionine---8-amino-7-oxononanoate aminotransferase